MGANDGDHLKVNYGSLDAAAEVIVKEAGELRRQMAEIQQKIKTVSETWDGEAQQAYKEVQLRWERRADDLQARLVSIAGEVQMASGSYSATDRRAASLFFDH